MKKLNIPLVLALGIGSVVTVVGVHFLHGYQVSRNADKLLTRVETAAEQSDLEEQIRLLSRYLRYRPDDIDNLKRLLEASREQLFTSQDATMKDVALLLAALEKAIRDNPEDADLRRQGYIFMSAIGRFGDALDNLEQLRAMGDLQPEDRIVLGRCLWMNGEPQRAMAELSDLTGFDLATLSFDDEKASAPAEVDAVTPPGEDLAGSSADRSPRGDRVPHPPPKAPLFRTLSVLLC